MEKPILEKFQALYEKQDILSKLTDDKLYTDISYSEVHCLAAIAELDEPNASAVVEYMHITRGAVSKIVKKLASKDLIEIFQKENNKKEKYYRLTKQGRLINARHTKAHNTWLERDIKFLQNIPTKDKDIISNFLDSFNSYLAELIKEKGK